VKILNNFIVFSHEYLIPGKQYIENRHAEKIGPGTGNTDLLSCVFREMSLIVMIFYEKIQHCVDDTGKNASRIDSRGGFSVLFATARFL
jgi:hypothetical protein